MALKWRKKVKKVSPVVEVHALHGEGVGASLLVLQDPRLHHHHHLGGDIHDEDHDLLDPVEYVMVVVG